MPADAENLLVGLDPADDAAVYKLDDERALVFTIDFFPPIVDDPDDFGTIAATNALNDVFAMGGVPLLALSVAALPEELPTETVRAIFDGADAAGERRRRDPGRRAHDSRHRAEVRPRGRRAPSRSTAIWPKAGALPGDALYLTKPLGTALVLGGAKRGLVDLGEAVAVDAHAEPRRGRRAAAVRAERRHRRHRVRSRRARARDGDSQRRAHRARSRPPAGARRRARRCPRGRLDGRNAQRTASTLGSSWTVSPTSWSSWPTTRRRRVVSSSRCRATRARRSRRSSRGQGCSSPASARSRQVRAWRFACPDRVRWMDVGAQPVTRFRGFALSSRAFLSAGRGERDDARRDRRHRRDRAAHRLRPRVRALAGLPAASFRAEELPQLHRVLEPRDRVLHDSRHARHLAARAAVAHARVRHLRRARCCRRRSARSPSTST